jgi:uncharacterized protein (TIGR02466 family)
LCAALSRVVLAHEAADTSVRSGARTKSSQGGWQSAADFFKWREPEIIALRDILVPQLTRMMQLAVAGQPGKSVEVNFGMAGWANVNRDGDFNVLHSHSNNHWSGAFYVNMGEPDPEVKLNGAFEFYEPRGAATMGQIPGFNFGHTLPIVPQVGMLMLFPSFMPHAVHPFRGKGERICIAFNAKVLRLEVNDAQPQAAAQS